MFQRVFRKAAQAGGVPLARHLGRHYFEAPGCEANIGPLVHVGDGGHITGFVGVNALPMVHDGRPLRAAICGSFMVEGREKDPYAGARLMKAMLAGPQDVTFSETASEVSTDMWTRLRGIVLRRHSLDWIKIIRPAAFGIDAAASRLPLLAPLGGLARPLDNWLLRRQDDGAPHWSSAAASPAPGRRFAVEVVGVSDFAALIEPLLAGFAVRPAWTGGQLDHILAEAMDKPAYGEPILAAVRAPGGATVGAFFYYRARGRIGRVLQVLARPGQEGAVIAALITDAAQRGVAGLRGRTQPALIGAMIGRRIGFVHVASTVMHSRHRELIDAFTTGAGFVNGLVGEEWSAIVGGRY